VADLATVTSTPALAKPETAAGSALTQGSEAIWVSVGILVVVGVGATVFLLRRGDTEPDRASDHAD
jgi:hypothetical protein